MAKVIVLDGSEYNHIIDADFTESKLVALPEWINDPTPDVDTDIWSRRLPTVSFTMRVTDAQKWTLDQLLLNHALVELLDYPSGTASDVWVKSVDAIYEGHINWSKPWRITLELIIGGEKELLEGDYSNWTEQGFSPIADGTIGNRFVAHVDDNEGIAYIGDTYGGEKFKKMNLETGTLTTLLNNGVWSLADADCNPSCVFYSVYRKYIICFDQDTNPVTLRIYKDGSLIDSWQFPLATLSYSASIGPKGKYIIIIDSQNRKYYVLEGS